MEKLRRLLETYSPVSRDYPRHMKLSKTSFRHYFTTTSIGQGSKPQNLVANKRSNGNWGNAAPFSESRCLHHRIVLACVANWARERKNLGTRKNMYPPNIDGWCFSKKRYKSSHSCSMSLWFQVDDKRLFPRRFWTLRSEEVNLSWLRLLTDIIVFWGDH